MASCRSSAGSSVCSRGCERPIDFEALDNQPVDLVFLLLAPEAAGADHLKALARVARLLRDPDIARRLRESRDADALYAVLAMPPASKRGVNRRVRPRKRRRSTSKFSEIVARLFDAPHFAEHHHSCQCTLTGSSSWLQALATRGLTRVGEHDRRAVGGMQREQLDAGRDFRRLRKQLGDVLGTDRLDVSKTAVAEMRQCLLRDQPDGSVFGSICLSLVMALDSFLIQRLTRSSPASRVRHSCSLIEIVFTIRSGCGRTRSIDNRPFFEVRAHNLHAVRQHECALELARGDAAVEILAGLVVLLPPTDHQLAFLDAHIELIAGESSNGERDAQPLRDFARRAAAARCCRAGSRRPPWQRGRARARSRRSPRGTGWRGTELATLVSKPSLEATLTGPLSGTPTVAATALRSLLIWAGWVKGSRTGQNPRPTRTYCRSFRRFSWPTTARFPPLTVRALRGDAGRSSAEFRARHQRGAIRKAPLLLVDLETEEGRHRPHLPVLLPAGGCAGDRQPARRSRADRERRGRCAGRTLGEACAPLHADRRAGHRAHGDVRLSIPPAGTRSRIAARHAACRFASAPSAEPYPRLQ